MNIRDLKGFNYQPSYGTDGLELWQRFNAETFSRELGLGKQYFPNFNGVRLWLSWAAFLKDRAGVLDKLEQALTILDGYGLKTVPVLFNRWHDDVLDYGGVYLDHVLKPFANKWDFKTYIDAVIGAHAADPRIIGWDLCNEPYYPFDPETENFTDEHHWLEKIYRYVKDAGAQAPIAPALVGNVPNETLEKVLRENAAVSDYINIHIYWVPARVPQEEYRQKLDIVAAVAAETGKDVLFTECCYGSLDDAERVKIIRFDLPELCRRHFGYLAYLLHTSRIADAHGPEVGPVGGPGNLAFIQLDGSLRPGHEAFNEF